MNPITCVKCGASRRTVRYVPPRESWESRFLNGQRVVDGSLDGEHLLKTCLNCGYQWTEPTGGAA